MATQVGSLLSYKQDDILGRGSYGTIVFRGFFHHENDKPSSVVVKRYQSSHVDKSLIDKEVDLIKKASGQSNILRYICTEIDTEISCKILHFSLKRLITVQYVYYTRSRRRFITLLSLLLSVILQPKTVT